MKTAISIISGYLGAGKTTLLKKIINDLDRKFAIIMNEFGEVGIDTDIIQGKNVNVAELAGGCVCCSLTGEFEEAVKEVIQNYSPEIIIVETTGVAEPDALVVDIGNSIPNTILDSVVTVADADALARFPTVGRAGKIQIEMGDIIILNKIDLVNETQRVEIKTKLRQYNEKAPMIEAIKCDVDISLLFGIETDRVIEKGTAHQTSFESFTTVPDILTREKIELFLQKLPNEIYRLKGFVELHEEGTHLLNYVAGRWELTHVEKHEPILVFIGENISLLKKKIEKEITK